MTPAELEAALTAIGWSARQLAIATGRSPSMAGDWQSDEPSRARIPPDVAAWLRRQAERIMADPPPRRAV